LIASGGRVLSVVAEADSLAEAQLKAYQSLTEVDTTDYFYREDIGAKASI